MMKSLIQLTNRAREAKFHIIGIGGIGMSGIAEILNNLGYKVQGSDLATNYNTERLTKLGIDIFIGHNSSNIDGVHYVVISSSIKPDNIEYQTAKALHIPIIKRSEMLAEIMKMKTCVSIAGSHGKTSTTAIIASFFEAANLSPTVINGGIINTKLTNAYVGKGEYMIVEADESDATFINIPSTIGVITNIDPEHLDYYQDFDRLYEAFKSFIHNLPFYGFAVCCADHPVTRKLANDIIDRKVITYGIYSQDANVKAFNIKTGINGSKFDVIINLPKDSTNCIIENLYISTPGEHNILNSLSAIAISAELDFGIKTIKEGLANFKGVKRRFTKTGEVNGVSFIDDYAHHPAEISATLNAAKAVIENNSTKKIIAVFQPHRYTRLASLFLEFVKSFEVADTIFILPVYSAGESLIEDYDHNKLAKAMQEHFLDKNTRTVENIDELESLIDGVAKEGDLVLFMGAGSITNLAYLVPQNLQAKLLKTAI